MADGIGQRLAALGSAALQDTVQGFEWLKLELLRAGVDGPVIVLLALGATLLLWPTRRWRTPGAEAPRFRLPRWSRPLLRCGRWLWLLPPLLFALYVVASEALYTMPREYLTRLPAAWESWLAGGEPGPAVPTGAAAFDYPSPARWIRGRPAQVFVFDADTVRVGGTKVRFNGIAAPEHGHPAYRQGRRELIALVRRADLVVCGLTGERSYDREIGYCLAEVGGERLDLQAELVAAGLARDCPRYSGYRYRHLEGAAARRLPLPGYCR